MLRDHVVHLRRRVASAEAPGTVDAVLISHVHHDHLDVGSLRGLDAPVYGPHGTARALGRLRRVVHELQPGATAEVGGAKLTAVPAVHDGRRWPVGAKSDEDALGFVIAADG